MVKKVLLWCSVLAIPVVLWVLLEHCLKLEPVVPGSQTEYVLEVAIVLLTIAAVPLAYKLKNFWIVIALLFVTLLAAVVVYELTLKSTALLCGAIVLLIWLYKMPKNVKSEK